MKESNAAAKLSDIKSGEMKEVSVGDAKVLLARAGDKCYAVGTNCTHYGAPLVEGALVDGRIICPWHHACFHAATGDMEDPPALDSLPSYPIRIEGEDIFVDLPEDLPDRRIPPMVPADFQADKRVFVIIGAGAAGYTAAQTLREDGFRGRIVMITRENRAPYDRPNLSKDYLQGHAEPEWMPLRPDEFFSEHGIELLLQKEVTRIEPTGKSITFADGEVMTFDSALIATGGAPRLFDIPGSDLSNIFYLRSFDDADAIIRAAENAKRVAIIGASFIGMETASSLAQRGLSVTIVAPDAVPFERTLGSEIGRLFERVHEDNGVRFRLGVAVKEFRGDGQVAGVLLDNGEVLETDLVVAGIGVSPATGFLEEFELHKDGGVIANEYLQIADGIFAAGDIVHFPDARTGEHTRFEHWRTAMQQGRTAAHNMAGKRTAFSSVPFFWTTQFDLTLNYVGHTRGWDEIIIDGDIGKRDFLSFYVKGGGVRAVAGVGRDQQLAHMEAIMKLGRMPSPETLRVSATVATSAANSSSKQ